MLVFSRQPDESVIVEVPVPAAVTEALRLLDQPQPNLAQIRTLLTSIQPRVIESVVVGLRHDRVRLGTIADRDVSVDRKEVYQTKHARR